MKRIAFVHNNFPAGGAERVTIDIARYLKSVGGYQVYVYTTRVSSSLLTDEVRDLVCIRTIPSQSIQSRRSAAVEEFLVQDHIDVLVQVGKSLSGIEPIKSRTGCKTVMACHGEPFWQRHVIMHRRQTGLFRRVMWYLWNRRRFADGTLAMRMAKERTLRDYLLNDAYTVLCDSYRDELVEALGLDATKAHVYAIENAENAVEDVCYKKENVILFCGRFENWSKRLDRLLRIWARVEPVLADWKLVLVGDGRDGKMLRGLAEDLKLQRVSFEGMQKNVAEYYRKASVVCLTSETEGWPLALTEGQAQGCIGVAFGATSGIKEILDGGCGFTVTAFDEAEFAQTLIKLASLDEDRIMEMRMNSVRKRAEYAPEAIADKWKKLFDMLVMQ